MLMRFDPFQELGRQAPNGTRRHPAGVPMDAYRDGDTVHVLLDLPGLSASDIDLTVEKNTLAVTATRSWEPGEGLQVFAAERPQGRFSRTLQLGDNLDTEALTAHYEDGVLHLSIPVADRAKPRRVEVGHRAKAGT